MNTTPRAWTAAELSLLGKMPDAEVARRTGRRFSVVWAKRRELGLAQLHVIYRKWHPAEDRLVGTAPDSVIAKRLGRTVMAVKSRRAVLERDANRLSSQESVSKAKPDGSVLKELRRLGIGVPRDASEATREIYHLVDAPYYPPRTARGKFLYLRVARQSVSRRI